MFAWFFLSALYLQLVLGYSPLQVGLAFLPANLIMAAFSLGLSAKLVMRFGIRAPLAGGLLLAAAGLLLFARAPVDGSFTIDVLPSMLLLGLGAGMAFNPVLLAAMSDVEPERVGPRLRRRQHLVHDGRRARARGPGQPGRRAQRQPAAAGDERSSPRSTAATTPRSSSVRSSRRGRRARRHAAAHRGPAAAAAAADEAILDEHGEPRAG